MMELGEGEWSTDRVEQELLCSESRIEPERAYQITLLQELDRRQVASGDGCRSLQEWTASRLDLAPETAKAPVRTSRHLPSLPLLCTVDGWQSRYRLGVHHLLPRSLGGNHHPDNLTTLCWYHHQVVVHGYGYRIDPHSPPGRRRLLKPNSSSGRDPP